MFLQNVIETLRIESKHNLRILAAVAYCCAFTLIKITLTGSDEVNVDFNVFSDEPFA